jgi:hypothetical protein
MRYKQSKNNSLSFKDQLLTAILAPIIFNIGMLITALALRVHRDRFIFEALYGTGKLLLLTNIAIPATLGFMLGSKRFSTILGHFFYSNIDYEKSWLKTILCWLGFLLLNYLVLSLNGLL